MKEHYPGVKYNIQIIVNVKINSWLLDKVQC